jgi:hypothetical protein
MPNSKFIPVVCAIAIVLIWVGILSQLAGITAAVNKTGQNANTKTTGLLSSSSRKVTDALGIKPAISFYKFQGVVQSPFNPPAPSPLKSSRAVNTSRPKLVLNGLLLKEKPLAILVDKSGTTAICAVGDTFNGQTVTAIHSDAVILSDTKGSYELSVIEK